MADQDQQPTGNLHVEKPTPPPGSVSAFQMSEEAAKTVADQTAKYVAEHTAEQARGLLPEIPTWVFVVGAAFWGTLAYGAWRALKATAPVLVPVALGVDPATAFAMQQGARRLQSARGGDEPPPRAEGVRGPPSGAYGGVPTTNPGAALGVSLTPETLAAILALAPAFGARSGTAEALGGIVASQAAAAASPPVSRRSSPGSARPSRREPPPEASRSSTRSRVPASTRPATAFDEDDAATTRPRGARPPASTTLRSA
jgi:hypothetical protein